MTTQLLPSIISSPFSSHFDPGPNIFRSLAPTYSVNPATSSTSLIPFFIHQDRQISSASVLSTASAPIHVNNENRHPLKGNANDPASSRSVSAHLLSTELRTPASHDNGQPPWDSSGAPCLGAPVPKPPTIKLAPKLSASQAVSIEHCWKCPNMRHEQQHRIVIPDPFPKPTLELHVLRKEGCHNRW